MSDQTVRPTVTHRLTTCRVPSFVRRAVPALLLVLAFVVPPVLVGGIGVLRSMHAWGNTTQAELSQSLPARPAHDSAKQTAVIVAGNAGTESSDLLGPYETLAASGAFNVYVVAPERRAAQLYPGDLAIVPHYAFAEYDATFPGRPDLVVVPNIQHTADADAGVLTWIREQAARGTTILSICAGAAVVADAGVLNGQTATTHRDWLATVERTHPEVTWVRGQRYVDAGQFISSAGVTSGVDATLYLLSRTFGRELADRTAATIGYPHTRFLDDPTWTNRPLDPLAYLPGAYRLDRDEIGLLLYDGVRELEVASVIDTYPRSFTASVRTLAADQRLVRSRHGLDLIPRSVVAAAPAVNRVLAPGNPSTPAAVVAIQAWTGQHPTGPASEAVHAAGDYLYDATLRDMARHDSTSVTIEAANLLEYPTRDLQLDGPARRLDLLLRPLVLGLLGLGAAIWLRRRAARSISTVSPSPRPSALRASIVSGGRFLLHFAEMNLAMVAGMVVFHGIAGGHGQSTASEIPWAVSELGMMVFMTVPMVAWMRVRGHSWRHGAEMSVGMLAPVVVIDVLVGFGFSAAWPWLDHAAGPAMVLGMLGAMLLRPAHYTGRHAHVSPPHTLEKVAA